MAMTWRTGGLFAAGALVGVVIGGWAMIQARDHAEWHQDGSTQAMGNGAAPAAAQSVPVAAATSAAPVPPPQVAAQSCDSTPIVAKGRGDGQESLQPPAQTASASEVAALILTGKEAVASGRARDAEMAFLNACRKAQVVQGSDAPVILADAMYQLGRLYANVAQGNAAHKLDLLARSQRMYQASLQTYQARYGAKGEKTRFAQEGLARVQRLAGGTELRPPAPVTAAAAPAPEEPRAVQHAEAKPQPAPRPVSPLADPPSTVSASAAPVKPPTKVESPAVPVKPPPRVESPAAVPVPDTSAAATRVHTQPSFDCSRARSAPEKIVCGDEDLARQDRELGRLHAKAEAAASDRAAFRRQNDAEWRRREDNCRDRECVQRWYAERRAQLEAAQPHAGATPDEASQAPAIAARPVPARSETSRAAPRFEQPARPAPETASGEPAQAEGSPNAQ